MNFYSIWCIMNSLYVWYFLAEDRKANTHTKCFIITSCGIKLYLRLCNDFRKVKVNVVYICVYCSLVTTHAPYIVTLRSVSYIDQHLGLLAFHTTRNHLCHCARTHYIVSMQWIFFKYDFCIPLPRWSGTVINKISTHAIHQNNSVFMFSCFLRIVCSSRPRTCTRHLSFKTKLTKTSGIVQASLMT